MMKREGWWGFAGGKGMVIYHTIEYFCNGREVNSNSIVPTQTV